MPNPEIEGTKYIWTFEHGVAIWLDRWKETREGLSAECRVRLGAGTLTQGRLNLSSLPTRSQWIKRLSQDQPDINWKFLLESVCLQALTAYRKGEPIEALTDCDDLLSVPWRLNPLIHEGVPTVLFGPGGIGKSYLAMYLALLAEAGHADHGYAPVKSRVLILDYEMEGRYARQRAMLLRRGHPALKDAVPLYQRCELPLAELVGDVANTIQKEQIGLLIVDSLAPAAGQDQNASQTAIGFFTALRHLRVSALVLAHVAKNTDQKSIYGSVFYSNLARSVFEAEGTGDGTISLHHRKHNFCAKQPSHAFTLTFQEESVQIRPAELPMVSADKLGDKLASLMRETPLTSAELIHHSGLEAQKVYDALSYGKKAKRWTQRKDETWASLD